MFELRETGYLSRSADSRNVGQAFFLEIRPTGKALRA